MELTRDGAGFAREQVVADKRFVRLELVSRQSADALGKRTQPVEPEIGLDAVQAAQRERDLAEVGVPSAFAQSATPSAKTKKAKSSTTTSTATTSTRSAVTSEDLKSLRAEPQFTALIAQAKTRAAVQATN